MSVVPLYHTSGSHKHKTALPLRAVMWSRAELARLMALYGQMVMANQWRDYAIDVHTQGQRGHALFCVFRHAQERPFYIVEKHVQAQAKSRPQYFLKNDTGQILTRNYNLDLLVRAFAQRTLRIVAS